MELRFSKNPNVKCAFNTTLTHLRYINATNMLQWINFNFTYLNMFALSIFQNMSAQSKILLLLSSKSSPLIKLKIWTDNTVVNVRVSIVNNIKLL